MKATSFSNAASILLVDSGDFLPPAAPSIIDIHKSGFKVGYLLDDIKGLAQAIVPLTHGMDAVI